MQKIDLSSLMTAEDIYEKDFKRVGSLTAWMTKKDCYDAESVDSFLDIIIRSYQRLYKYFETQNNSPIKVGTPVDSPETLIKPVELEKNNLFFGTVGDTKYFADEVIKFLAEVHKDYSTLYNAYHAQQEYIKERGAEWLIFDLKPQDLSKLTPFECYLYMKLESMTQKLDQLEKKLSEV